LRKVNRYLTVVSRRRMPLPLSRARNIAAITLRRVSPDGEDRARAVGVGRSGLCVSRGPQRGVRVNAERDVVTGIIGARRAWTVSMISALSMPCR
jgi:hypothetical protein